MTEQEKRIQEQTEDAIEVLGFLKKDFENKAKPRCKFARVRAGLFFGIKALEKQIAKKPRFYAHNYYCTECGNLVGNNEFEWQRFLYCDKCGQKLDWE